MSKSQAHVCTKTMYCQLVATPPPWCCSNNQTQNILLLLIVANRGSLINLKGIRDKPLVIWSYLKNLYCNFWTRQIAFLGWQDMRVISCHQFNQWKSEKTDNQSVTGVCEHGVKTSWDQNECKAKRGVQIGWRDGVCGGGGCLVWLGVIWSNLLHVNLSEQQEPDYPSNNGHMLIC